MGASAADAGGGGQTQSSLPSTLVVVGVGVVALVVAARYSGRISEAIWPGGR